MHSVTNVHSLNRLITDFEIFYLKFFFSEMARIDDAQKQYFEDLEQEKIDELKLFKERQQEEQKLVQKA